ncbi:MAG TPA: AMP-binding protein [Mycobacteriales bacterium]|jgi:O-succinylbenzoic acid--CoA ligase|nr:AMP-binding protein [Mycobacteriales bacterium]
MPATSEPRLVALALPPGEQFVAALEAAWAAGDAVLPIDPGAPAGVTEPLIAAMRLDEPVDPDVALVIATSGSTGEPKGAQLSRSALEASARATHARIGLDPGDRWLSCLPWQHIGGIQVMLRARLLGIALRIQDRFDVDRFAATDATLTSLVPTQLTRLLDAKVDLGRFRAILLGGDSAPAALLARAATAGARVVTTYGMSETAGGCVYDGMPLDGVRVRIGAGSRIEIAGPTLMSGYRLRPDLTAAAFADGWLVTSDLGEVDGDGRLRVTGRADDIVISGGENVVTSHVADVLSGHPELAEVAVTGVDDPAWGQRIVAVVVPRRAGRAPSLAQLRDWCDDRLPAAARPRGLVVVAALPRLGSGKPDRLEITRLAVQRSGDDL